MKAECRSPSCHEPATAFAEVMYKGRAPSRKTPGNMKWDGNFCTEHLLRVLPMKMETLRSGWSISIKRSGDE